MTTALTHYTRLWQLHSELCNNDAGYLEDAGNLDAQLDELYRDQMEREWSLADPIGADEEEYSLSGYTAVIDREHKLVRETGATVTPEAVVILADGSIPYRGRIDNMYPNLGQRRRVITEKDLRAALDAVGENRSVKVSRTQAVGCYIPNI